MSMNLNMDQSAAWLPSQPDGGVAISSRVRLARNVKDAAFPGWAGEDECVRVCELLTGALTELPSLQEPSVIHMDRIGSLEKQLLFERHLISREHLERGAGSVALIRDDQRISVMINEEDHLRIQSLSPGLDLSETWKRVDALDNEIEAQLDYAFSPKIGYLTACPTNVGTGMRASVMLHVPGLVLMGEINAVIKGMAKIGLAVRGLWGEGSEAAGNMFQVSNQMTLGEKEPDIVRNLEQIVLEIVEHEKNARSRLFDKKESLVRDHAGRALGILSNAHVLTSKEALDLLSDLRLGVDLGIVEFKDYAVINDLTLWSQPGHLQKWEKRLLKPEERDVARARLVRSRIQKNLIKSRRKKNE